MTLDNKQIPEVTTPTEMVDDISKAIATGAISVGDLWMSDQLDDDLSSAEVFADNVEFRRYASFDTPWTQAYEVVLNGKKVWIEQRISTTTKAMFSNMGRTPARYRSDWSVNMSEIWKYYTQYHLTNTNSGKRSLCLTIPGPLYEPDNRVTWIWYDNGVQVWTDTGVEWTGASGKGICYIENGKIHFSHASEMSNEKLQELIDKSADIFTLPSVKRNDNINSNNSLRDSEYNHYLVKHSDGTIAILYLQGTAEEKKKIIASTDIERALYMDAVGNNGQIDQFWKSDPEGGNMTCYYGLKNTLPSPKTGAMPNLIHLYVEE